MGEFTDHPSCGELTVSSGAAHSLVATRRHSAVILRSIAFLSDFRKMPEGGALVGPFLTTEDTETQRKNKILTTKDTKITKVKRVLVGFLRGTSCPLW